jgi:AraC-like DNA-binding protein
MKNSVYRISSITELHAIAGFEKPRHPLVSVVDFSKVAVTEVPDTASFSFGFYSVNLKKNCHFRYGMQSFDHQEGTLHCSAPEQVITFDRERDTGKAEGWGLFFHPDLLRNTALGKKMPQYTFFSYAENEALHLSDQEKQTFLSILRQMENEYNTNIDAYSHELILSNIELLLNYCKRFYGRQFLTRTHQQKDVIARFEAYISDYVNSKRLQEEGLPTVRQCADAMNLSPNYFSDLLKSETGKNAQEHIHYHILEKAKNLLAVPGKTVNEIAFELGFEYPQNFSKLFKKKTGFSPVAFRNEPSKN